MSQSDDLISRQAAIDAMCSACWDWCDEGVCKRVSALQQLPSAQPDLSAYSDKLWRAAYERGKREAEAERKRGKWINDEHDMPRCSCCGYMPEYNRHIDDYYYSDYCPNCGADMRGGDEG